jgi:hypothetical protein
MKTWYALARSLARSAPLWRQQLMTAVADHLAAGDTKAAERAGRFLDRRAYGEACQRAARLRRVPTDRAIASFVSRCFELLHDLAARLRFMWPPRPSHGGAKPQAKAASPAGRRRTGGGTP